MSNQIKNVINVFFIIIAITNIVAIKILHKDRVISIALWLMLMTLTIVNEFIYTLPVIKLDNFLNSRRGLVF